MLPDIPVRIDIGPIPTGERPTALARLFGDLAPAIRERHVADLLADEAAGRIDMAGILAATDDNGHAAGYIWSQRQAGKVASIWAPWVRPTSSDRAAQRLGVQLIVAATQWAVDHGVDLAQTLLLRDAMTLGGWFAAAGYIHLTDLVYMVAQAHDFGPATSTAPIRFESYTPANHARFVHTIERTYVDTLDCPLINGVRDTEDTLDTYRSIGRFDARRWLLAVHGASDVGCLLVNDHPQDDQCELVYMGIVPEFRGRRWGSAFTEQAQALTVAAGRARLLLAVDAYNTPALSAYVGAKFEIFDRRQVYIKRLR